MPFMAVKDEQACSVSNPWAVFTKNPDGSRGRRHGCHTTEADANKQVDALNASGAGGDAGGAGRFGRMAGK